MNVRYRKIAAIGFCWTLVFLFAARLFAALLCSPPSRSYTDADGNQVHMVYEADPELVRNLMFSPVFAIPAVIVLVGGWLLIWRKFSGRSHSGRPPRTG